MIQKRLSTPFTGNFWNNDKATELLCAQAEDFNSTELFCDLPVNKDIILLSDSFFIDKLDTG